MGRDITDRGECIMKAAIIFSGMGPILIATSCESLEDPVLIRNLHQKGIAKFITCEVPIDKVKEMYGRHYTSALRDVSQSDELRVIDHDGVRILNNFPFDQLREPFYCERECVTKAA